MRIVLLVSSDTSDIFFANQLMKKLSVVGVVVEKQRVSYKKSNRIVKALKIVLKPIVLIKRIFEEIEKCKIERFQIKNTEINREYFGEEGKKLSTREGCKIIYTDGSKAINKPVYVEEIKNLDPDIIAVCGTSLLKKEILSIPPKGAVNLHGGLAQEYRGVWTTHWCLVNEQPEYIGATVHFISEGIDDGNIIYQGRPQIDVADNPGTLYVKVVKLGIEMMIKAIQDIEGGAVISFPLVRKGKLYQEKMMTYKEVGNAWENTEKGVVRQYLKDKERRDEKVEAAIIRKYDNNQKQT